MSHFTLPLGIEFLEITPESLDSKGTIVPDVKNKHTSTPCHKCGRSTSKVHGNGEVLTVQHLPILDQPVFLRICVVRYPCMDCDDHPTTSERFSTGICQNVKKCTKPH